MSLLSFFKKLRLGQLLTILIAGIALFLTTACNPGNIQGARPDNLPVQAGGNNNPHTMGGDGYTNYKMSTDPSVNLQPNASQDDRAELQSAFYQLVADSHLKSDASELLYPGSDATSTDNPDIGTRSVKSLEEQTGQSVADGRQPVIDRSDPDSKILERTGQAFRDASGFLKSVGGDAANDGIENTRK